MSANVVRTIDNGNAVSRAGRLMRGIAIAVALVTVWPPGLHASTDAEWRWSGVERVIAVPDVHGAYPELIRLLQAAGVIDEALRWSGGDAHLVSLGDLLDRGPRSRAVMDLLMRLQTEAEAAGGRVHVVAGNHELMNLIGDLRYVSNGEYAEFIDEESAAEREAAWLIYREATDSDDWDPGALRAAFDAKYPPGFFGHRRAFSADGRYGRWIVSLPIIVVVNDTAFVHGGLPPNVIGRSLADINRHYSRALTRYLALWRRLIDAGVLPDDTGRDPSQSARTLLENADPSDCVEVRRDECVRVEEAGEQGVWAADPEILETLREFVAISDDPVLGADSPLWYRGAVYCRALFERPILDAALENFGVGRLVVGHTVTEDRRVHAIHDDRLIMLDTGMLAEYYRGRPSALVLEGGEAIVQHADPLERVAPLRDRRPVAFGLTGAELRDALSSGPVDAAELPAAPVAVTVRRSRDLKALPATLIPDGRTTRIANVLAADALDRALGLELVPATVAREIGDEAAALQLRDPEWVSEAERQARGIGIGGWCGLERQYQLMYAWDLLIGNFARSADDILYDRSLGRLVLTGHGSAFPKSSRLPSGLNDGAIRIEPELAAVLGGMTRDSLQVALGEYLKPRQIKALLARRDEMLERFSAPRAARR